MKAVRKLCGDPSLTERPKQTLARWARRGDVDCRLLHERRAAIIVGGARPDGSGSATAPSVPLLTLLPEATRMSVLHRIEASAERARASARQLPRVAGDFTSLTNERPSWRPPVGARLLERPPGECVRSDDATCRLRAQGHADFVGAILGEGRARRRWSRTVRVSAHRAWRRAPASSCGFA
jgi:hypothetical protein